jgi:hypothetical protein
MLFIEEPAVMELLANNKTRVREIVAALTGYDPEAIAVIPEMVSRALLRLSDNLLPLEFVIDAGTKCANRSEDIALAIKNAIVTDIPEFGAVHFGIWFRTMTDNGFVEHKPASV